MSTAQSLTAFVAVDPDGKMKLETLALSEAWVEQKLNLRWSERDWGALGWRFAKVQITEVEK